MVVMDFVLVLLTAVVGVTAGYWGVRIGRRSVVEKHRVRAQSIELVDAAGLVRGSFALTDDGAPVLCLRDAMGRERGAFELSTDGTPCLSLSDACERERGVFVLAEDGQATLVLIGNGRGGTKKFYAVD